MPALHAHECKALLALLEPSGERLAANLAVKLPAIWLIIAAECFVPALVVVADMFGSLLYSALSGLRSL